MSRRPGIGSTFMEKFQSDIYPRGYRVVNGRDMRPPRFYDEMFKSVDPVAFEDLQFRRKLSLDKSDCTDVRLGVREQVTLARLKMLPRSFSPVE